MPDPKKVIELAPKHKKTFFSKPAGQSSGPGKGSHPRPMTDKEHFDKEHIRIFGK